MALFTTQFILYFKKNQTKKREPERNSNLLNIAHRMKMQERMGSTKKLEEDFFFN